MEIDDIEQLTELPSPESVPQAIYLDCLKQHFGHTAFRPFQWTIIRTILEDRRDVCAVVANENGKSLCFQFPSVFQQGITFVVSPQIRLMQYKVKMSSIPSCYLDSAQTDCTILDKIWAGEYRIVYMSPEYITTYVDLVEHLASKLTMIAIDEAHCVSEWGHDYRPGYCKINKIKERAPSVPILAVTTVATVRVRYDICANMGMRNPKMLSTGFDRPNLDFIFLRKETMWEDLESFVEGRKRSTIVFCQTENTAEEVVQTLLEHGVDAAAYHARMSSIERQDIYERFVKDKLQIIVATNDFAMAIDKPNVRLVIHYGASDNIESYYQEVGRAGRDGLPSSCVLLYSIDDFDWQDELMSSTNFNSNVVVNYKKLALEMEEFVFSNMCRRLFMLQYFDGSKCEPHYDCCDNCRDLLLNLSGCAEMDEMEELIGNCKLFLQAVKEFLEIEFAQSLLHGKASNLPKYQNHDLNGAGKHKSSIYWSQLADMLELEGFIAKSRRNPNNIDITSKGQSFLSKGIWIQPTTQMIQLMQKNNVEPPKVHFQETLNVDDALQPCQKASTTQSTPENIQCERLVNSLMAFRSRLPDCSVEKAQKYYFLVFNN